MFLTGLLIICRRPTFRHIITSQVSIRRATLKKTPTNNLDTQEAVIKKSEVSGSVKDKTDLHGQ